ncbi:hypothetical protein [Microbacterium album]|uniref:Uncharacterized protein n=1 Tax=Microbacterium album TaxID=2053191 RepID=A0A917MJY6_9MICO|nr:hypothetical protein [Microbacterium album]GGH33789.1 hypothetical protein GCM10010921_01030 [Microbacterium album]
MASTPTSSGQAPEFRVLRLKSHSGAQIWINNLGGVHKFDVLQGARFEPSSVTADPHGRLGDLIGTGWAVLLATSQAFVEAVREAELTGCQFLPLEVTGREDIGQLSLLQVLGRCGPKQKVEYGERIDRDSWDGSDFFVAPNYGGIFLSPRAVEVLRRAKLCNVDLEPPRAIFD